MNLYLVYETLPQGDRLYYAGSGEEGPFRTYSEWSVDRSKAVPLSAEEAHRTIRARAEWMLAHEKLFLERLIPQGDDIYALAEANY